MGGEEGGGREGGGGGDGWKRRGRRRGEGEEERWEVRRIYICILWSPSITSRILKRETAAYNVVGDELHQGGVVIYWFNSDSDVGWIAPLTSIKDFKHDPRGGVCVCVWTYIIVRAERRNMGSAVYTFAKGRC